MTFTNPHIILLSLALLVFSVATLFYCLAELRKWSGPSRRCPECSRPMLSLPRETPINWAMDSRLERYRCVGCSLVADVDVGYWRKGSPDAVQTESVK